MKQISLKGRAYPRDLNHSGTVFGGWIMSKMDQAASIAVEDIVDSPAVTVLVSDLHFLKPIRNGDIVIIRTTIKKIGNSSIAVDVEVMVRCTISHEEYNVTNALFTFVTVDPDGNSRAVSSVLRNDVPEYVKELAWSTHSLHTKQI